MSSNLRSILLVFIRKLSTIYLAVLLLFLHDFRSDLYVFCNIVLSQYGPLILILAWSQPPVILVCPIICYEGIGTVLQLLIISIDDWEIGTFSKCKFERYEKGKPPHPSA